jgi:hypothetical protein
MNLQDCINLSGKFNNDRGTIANVKESLLPRLEKQAEALLIAAQAATSVGLIEQSNGLLDDLDIVKDAIKACLNRLNEFEA